MHPWVRRLSLSFRPRRIVIACSQFEAHREALYTAKLEAPKTLQHESQVYWGAISLGTCDFHKEPKDCVALRALTKADVLAYWNETFDASAPGRRKLSTQIFAAHHLLPARRLVGVNGRTMHYVDGVRAAVEYRRTLAAFPATTRYDKSGTSGW